MYVCKERGGWRQRTDGYRETVGQKAKFQGETGKEYEEEYAVNNCIEEDTNPNTYRCYLV